MNGGILAPPADLLIDDCEVAWTGTTGVMATINATPTAGGSGYTAGDILDVTTGGTGGKVQVSTVDGGGAVTAITHYAGGYGGYTTGTGKATSGGTGSGCAVNIATVGNTSPNISTTQVHDGTYSFRMLVGTAAQVQRTLIAHHTIEEIDLSEFSRIKAWLLSSPGTFGAGRFRLCLCSDTAGRDVVDEIVLPATTGSWAEANEARAGAGALGSAIRSIALYSIGSGGAGTLYIDQIRVSA